MHAYTVPIWADMHHQWCKYIQAPYGIWKTWNNNRFEMLLSLSSLEKSVAQTFLALILSIFKICMHIFDISCVWIRSFSHQKKNPTVKYKALSDASFWFGQWKMSPQCLSVFFCGNAFACVFRGKVFWEAHIMEGLLASFFPGFLSNVILSGLPGECVHKKSSSDMSAGGYSLPSCSVSVTAHPAIFCS